VPRFCCQKQSFVLGTAQPTRDSTSLLFCVTGLETSTLGACAPSLGSNRFPGGSAEHKDFLELAETSVEAAAEL
jgi:hypothetical protein